MPPHASYVADGRRAGLPLVLEVRVRTVTRFSLLIETDDPALRAQIDEIANLPTIERDEMIAELMGWESRRILRNVGHARGRESAFAHNRRGKR